MIDLAIKAHIKGDFLVCRKVHLTEGLLAIIKSKTAFRANDSLILEFLHGQIEILYTIGYLIKNIEGNNDLNVRKLRKLLVISDDIENHLYYAGHLFELITLAVINGYKVNSEVINLMIYVSNFLNKNAFSFINKTKLEDSFLHFGHYRRGITLLNYIINSKNKKIRSEDALKDYTLEISTKKEVPKQTIDTRNLNLSSFSVIDNYKIERPLFNKLINQFKKKYGHKYSLTGGFTHFRRILIKGWPRSVHYEFLDYEDKIGIELHIESLNYLALKPILEDIIAVIINQNTEFKVYYDEAWYNGCGRVILFSKNEKTESLIEGMILLIEKSRKLLTLKLDEIIND